MTVNPCRIRIYSAFALSAAAASLSLAQAMGTVLSVAVIGGIFGFSNDRYLTELANSALTIGEQETQAFMRAFQDVFWLGAGIAAVGAAVFLFSWRKKAA